MRTRRYQLAFAVAVIGLVGGPLVAQDSKDDPQPEKIVRLVWFPRFSPDGKWLAAGGWDDQIKVYDLATQEEKWSWQK